MTRARQLWKSATQHERLLWRHLRNRQLQGWKFRRQHPVDRDIIDFYCHEERPAIELDGGGHNFANRESLDQERTRFLASKNILVLRFWKYLINRELRSVLETIWSTLSDEEIAHLDPRPLRKGEADAHVPRKAS